MPGGGALDDLSRGGSTTPSGPTPGLREQVGATRGAAVRLIGAHVALARAEFAGIAAEIKRFAVAAGIVFGMLFFVGILVPVGSVLFIGDWLFGSLGWGVLHGLELAIAVSVTAVLAALGASARQLSASFGLGLVVAVIMGVVLGLDLANQGWTRLGDNVLSAIEPGVRPLVTAVAMALGAFAILGLLAGLRMGGIGGGIGGLFGGALLGVVLGAFTAIHWDSRAGAALGVAIGLGVWPAVLGVFVYRSGIDFEAIKNRLIPNQTIDTTRETIEWMRQQTPLGRKS